MIGTASKLYLRSLPKTGTTATEAALREAWAGCIHSIKGEGGHARVWAADKPMRDRRLVFGTTAPPLVWYRRVYLHAVDSNSDNMMASLRAYGQGKVDFPAVLYGMTHPAEITLPDQVGLIFRGATRAAVALQVSGVGLWSWAHWYFFGTECPGPGLVPEYAVDALVDSLQLEAGLTELTEMPVSVPQVNVRRPEMTEWALESIEGTKAAEWVREADSDVMALLGYEDVDQPRVGGPVWRP